MQFKKIDLLAQVRH